MFSLLLPCNVSQTRAAVGSVGLVEVRPAVESRVTSSFLSAAAWQQPWSRTGGAAPICVRVMSDEESIA